MFNSAQSMQFRGQSGTSYLFRSCSAEGGWAQLRGVVIFAARDALGWRIVDTVIIRNQEDLGPVWRWREARRYGAQAVFTHPVSDPVVAARIKADLDAEARPIAQHSSFGAGVALAA